VVKRHELKLILIVSICWVLIDLGIFMFQVSSGTYPFKYADRDVTSTRAIFLREVNVFFLSLIICFMLISVLRNFLRNSSLWLNLVAKTMLLIVAAVVMSFFIYVSYEMLIHKLGLIVAMKKFMLNTFRPEWFLPKMLEWMLLFILTQLAIEINEKYSPGVFVAIMMGKYLQPREEERIIMFIDLRNSTPIAEKLGSKEYFQFIRDFIFCISAGIMEHGGRIYQYVGDEVVAWWPSSAVNAKKVIASLIASRKILNKNTEIFKSAYGILPEYKAGIHAGTVTVGQVGISKKELVMSGDTINTASRIRSACTDLNQKFLISKDMVDLVGMEAWQSESLGLVDLKGKNQLIELFALRI
jgi:adenylate cyclase